MSRLSDILWDYDPQFQEPLARLHVLVDFPTPVLRRLQVGDRVQIHACGLGLRLLDYPEITVFNCSPALLKRWGLSERHGALEAPVTHLLPAAIMDSGLGKNTV